MPASREEERNASGAAKRIASLIGATQNECQNIQRQFFDDPTDSFCKIRNRIAHGDPHLSTPTVQGKYPSLHKYVTAAIVTLLNLPPGAADSTQDYYDEISRFTDDRFQSLPPN